MLISVSYWFVYESAQRGRRYLNSTSNNSSSPGASTDNEKMKFGTRYGAVVNN